MSDRTPTSPILIIASLLATAFLLWTNLRASEASSPWLNAFTWVIIGVNVVFLISTFLRRK